MKNKIALVTGASKGIGRGIALELAKQKVKVVVNYASDKNGAEKVVKEIKDNGGEALALQADVAEKESVKQLFSKIKSEFGSLDILVNNAGVYRFEPIEAVSYEEYKREFDINVWGILATIQEAIPLFQDNNGGCVINISSAAVTHPGPAMAVYAATKAAVNSITASLAKELGSRNIRVNSILPGLTNTEGTHDIGVIGSEMEQFMVSQTPLGRVGNPNDIAKVAVFLASDNAAWISGQNIEASGGF